MGTARSRGDPVTPHGCPGRSVRPFPSSVSPEARVPFPESPVSPIAILSKMFKDSKRDPATGLSSLGRKGRREASEARGKGGRNEKERLEESVSGKLFCLSDFTLLVGLLSSLLYAEPSTPSLILLS